MYNLTYNITYNLKYVVNKCNTNVKRLVIRFPCMSSASNKIGPVVLPLWVVENRPFPLLWPLAYTTACTTLQAVIPHELDLSFKVMYFVPEQFRLCLFRLIGISRFYT